MTKKSDIGVIGLAVMGANLARNLANKGLSVSVFNRTYAKTQELIDNYGQNLVGYEKIEDFIDSLQTPRRIIIMVKSGQPVDDLIAELMPVLGNGDIILDGGNSNWLDTLRRQEYLDFMGSKGRLVGMGISGGEEGALHGPSFMPGGNEVDVKNVLPVLEQAAALDFSGKPCVTNIGTGPSGHFVKMVHNGIEYALMQGIAEIYDILNYNSFSQEDLIKEFGGLNQGALQSYLLDITIQILGRKTESGDAYLVDKISDVAMAKGTGKWTVEAVLEFGVFAPTISAAVLARIGSARSHSFKTKTLELSKKQVNPEPEILKEYLHKALMGLYLSSYLQGIDLITQANSENNWNIQIAEVLRVWQGGCIIRSKLLNTLYHDLQHEYDFSEQIAGLDYLTSFSINRPIAVLRSSLDYFLTLTSARLPTNLIQAQRDYFGAHTYKRIDQQGDFTGGWVN
jgi:6-phosphogluconate dehydrogenase